jgi:hypothetical protein
MAVDFTVIRALRARFGDSTEALAGEEQAPHVGVAEAFSFNCPAVDSDQMAVLEFESIDVTVGGNVMMLNGKRLSAPIRKTPGDGANAVWTANVVLVDKGVLRPMGNILHVESRNANGGANGNRDNFILDNIVIFYKTA